MVAELLPVSKWNTAFPFLPLEMWLDIHPVRVSHDKAVSSLVAAISTGLSLGSPFFYVCFYCLFPGVILPK